MGWNARQKHLRLLSLFYSFFPVIPPFPMKALFPLKLIYSKKIPLSQKGLPFFGNRHPNNKPDSAHNEALCNCEMIEHVVLPQSPELVRLFQGIIFYD